MSFDLSHVDFRYRDKPVLKSLHLHLSAEKFYGILGPNGSGKTTLIDLLVRHRSPDSGIITYYGRDLRSYSKQELSRQIALVPQNFYVNFPFRVEDIVIMGRYPHMPRFTQPSAKDWEVVDTVLELTDTAPLRHRYVTELSGGERQRVVFARALAQSTRVLLLDEATSNMDVKHGLQVLEISRHLSLVEKTTIVAVFQDINLAAAYCDELVFLKQGTVAAAGPTDQVLTAETIRAVFGIEAKVSFDSYVQAKQVVFKGNGLIQARCPKFP